MKGNLSLLLQKRLCLPILINRQNKLIVLITLYIASFTLYIAANRIHLYPPQLLPTTWLDSATPFLPNTVWIYISEYLFFAVVFFNSRDIRNLNKYFYSFVSLLIISITFFWIWPTTYPRDMFPLLDDLNPLTHFAFSTLRAFDTPASCCPSIHVGAVFLSSFIFLDDQRHKFPIFFIWATMIAVSTLTTKQHYAVDVIAGLFMAVSMYWIFHKLVSYNLAKL